MLEYQLKKKKEEMAELMTRFTQTNTNHQHLMNENIRLVAQIRKRKKEEVRKIKDKQKDKFKRKVKNLKKTIMKQSKVGGQGETILRNSVLEKHFDKVSTVEDAKSVQKEESTFFSKIKESMMIFGGNPSKEKGSRSPAKSKNSKSRSRRTIPSSEKKKYNFKKPAKGSTRKKLPKSRRKFLEEDESQIIVQRKFRGDSDKDFQITQTRSKINNISDMSEDRSTSPPAPTSITRKKVKSTRFSPSKKLKTGPTLAPRKTLNSRQEEPGHPELGLRHVRLIH